jgi:hypothetical protein
LLVIIAVGSFYLTSGVHASAIQNRVSQPKSEKNESAMKILQIDVKINQPLHLSSPGMVEVQIKNKSVQAMLLNKRLAVGYGNSLSRELFLEVYKKHSDELVSRQARLYERNFSSLEDYIWIEPGQSISCTFNLFEWYVLPSSGDYEMVMYYQADETLALKPVGLLTGTYASERISLTVKP